MASGNDIRDFLVTRRARLSPVDAGLPDFGGRRRVPGLRREEVALIAGVSTQYYVRFERGDATGVSESVLDGISRALKLDDAEHAHLFALVRAANAKTHPLRKRPGSSRLQARHGVQQTIDAMKDVPAIVQNGRLDIVAWNTLGQALFAELFSTTHPANFARFVFLAPSSQDYYRNWEEAAQQTVALLRSEAGRAPNDRSLSDLIGELSTKSSPFAKLWASHNVREHRTGSKLITHPLVGDIDLTFEVMDLSSDRGLQILAYTAEPGSSSHEALQLLANMTFSSSLRNNSHAESAGS
jgi:transcriptional regulator with XRE-family HTH domain